MHRDFINDLSTASSLLFGGGDCAHTNPFEILQDRIQVILIGITDVLWDHKVFSVDVGWVSNRTFELRTVDRIPKDLRGTSTKMGRLRGRNLS